MLNFRDEEDHLVVELEGDQVTRCLVDFAFSLQFLETGALIQFEQPFVIRTPAGEQHFDPVKWGDLGPALQALLTKKVISAKGFRSGRLEVVFEGGVELYAEPHPKWESWHVVTDEVGGPMIHTMPGGRLAIWDRALSEPKQE